jgi:methylated-DNA-[protein]-cysteine S-methyltransferase
MMSAIQYQTPIGNVTVTIENGVVTALRWGKFDPIPCRVRVNKGDDPLSRQVGEALQHFFSQSEKDASVPLQMSGTPFQQKVWRALQQIPPGEVRTYGELAKQLHSSARAVGGACRRNPVPLLVPCHRVVAAHGVGGFAGRTQGKEVALKRWLLEHEGVSLEK